MESTRSLSESGDGLELALLDKRRVAMIEARQFDHLLQYLSEWGTETTSFSVPGGERLHQYGGSGTPKICEFAVCEIAGALGMTPNGASRLVADILDLAHRLPCLYGALHAGRVEAWRVRRVATATRDFTMSQASQADKRLSADTVGDGTPMLCRVSRSRFNQVLEQIRNRTCPEEAEQDVTDASNERRVSIRPIGSGLAALDALLSDEDGARIDQRLAQIVGWLHALGDERPTTVLRAVALGYLAEPDTLDTLYDQVCRQRAQRTRDEPGDDGVGRTARRPLPATTVYLHLDRGTGTWSMDGVGAITPAEARNIVGHTKVTLKPVIDLAETLTYTGYVAPPRLKEQLALMNAGLCTFPFCDRPARGAQYDHMVDFADGGPTDSRNGHRLCTFHHRAKTFTEWIVRTPSPGVWLWHSPVGRAYLVTAGSTTRIDTHRRRRERTMAA